MKKVISYGDLLRWTELHKGRFFNAFLVGPGSSYGSCTSGTEPANMFVPA